MPKKTKTVFKKTEEAFDGYVVTIRRNGTPVVESRKLGAFVLIGINDFGIGELLSYGTAYDMETIIENREGMFKKLKERIKEEMKKD